ncbi:MAG: DUF934 domain-containing protein [Aquisalimonadaceae bacterium]
MRKIIRDRTIVDDHWQHIADEDTLPVGDITVSWQRWNDERDALLARDGKVGVRLNGDVPVAELPNGLEQLDLVAVEFPAFKDGRCYSHARLLRVRHGYLGEIRAVGDVLRDQLAYMERVGINAFEVREDRSVEDALNAFSEISVDYQGMSGTSSPLHRRRA